MGPDPERAAPRSPGHGSPFASLTPEAGTGASEEAGPPGSGTLPGLYGYGLHASASRVESSDGNPERHPALAQNLTKILWSVPHDFPKTNVSPLLCVTQGDF